MEKIKKAKNWVYLTRQRCRRKGGYQGKEIRNVTVITTTNPGETKKIKWCPTDDGSHWYSHSQQGKLVKSLTVQPYSTRKMSIGLNLHVSEEVNTEACTSRRRAGIAWRRERTAGSRWQWDTVFVLRRGGRTLSRGILRSEPCHRQAHGPDTSSLGKTLLLDAKKTHLEGSSPRQPLCDEGKEKQARAGRHPQQGATEHRGCSSLGWLLN